MSMLSSVSPWDAVAEGYAEITMKLFQGYADEALKRVVLNQHSHVLDVGCGPGTLSLSVANQVKQVQAIDFSSQMLVKLQQSLHQQKIGNVDLFCGDAQTLPYDANQFDAAFSLFALMFFPNRNKGFAEIHRVLKPEAKVVVSSWAPITQSPAMLAVFGAIQAINPEIPNLQADLNSLENPDLFKKEMEDAGFKSVRVEAVTQHFSIDNVETFWRGMVKGNAIILIMKNKFTECEWAAKEKMAIDYLKNHVGECPVTLSADAWFATGMK